MLGSLLRKKMVSPAVEARGRDVAESTSTKSVYVERAGLSGLSPTSMPLRESEKRRP